MTLKGALCNISSLTDRTGLFFKSRAVYLMKIHTRLPYSPISNKSTTIIRVPDSRNMPKLIRVPDSNKSTGLPVPKP